MKRKRKALQKRLPLQLNASKKQHYMTNLIFASFFYCLSCTDAQAPNPYIQIGEASYYARMFEGRPTASGTLYREDSLTAAHRTLPMGTVVKIENLRNQKSVIVEINDRGPYAQGRIIDLSRAAAKKLKMLDEGVAEVRLEVVEPAPGYSISDSVELEQIEPAE